MRRWAAGLLFILALGALRAPATLLDDLASELTRGEVRLAEARGTVWRGSAVLAVRDATNDHLGAWLPVQWTAEPRALLRGALAWRLDSGGSTLARLEVHAGGLQISDARLRGAARNFAERIPHPFAHAGWNGDAALEVPALECSWRMRCAGRVNARWTGASSDLLANRPLGDYEISIDIRPQEQRFVWRTLRGPLAIDGGGSWREGSGAVLKAALHGDAQLLDQLPGVAGRWARPTGDPRSWTIAYPQ